MSDTTQSRAIHWLETYQLSEYENLMREIDCLDIDTILELTEEEMKDVGMALGTRKKFLKAIKASQEEKSQGDQSAPHGVISYMSYAKPQQPSCSWVWLNGILVP